MTTHRVPEVLSKELTANLFHAAYIGRLPLVAFQNRWFEGTFRSADGKGDNIHIAFLITKVEVWEDCLYINEVLDTDERKYFYTEKGDLAVFVCQVPNEPTLGTTYRYESDDAVVTSA